MASTFRWGGRNWGAGDQKKFAAWLSKRGASLGQWAENHPDLAGAHFPGYLEGAVRGTVTDPRALNAAIAARANSMQAPEQSLLEAQQKKNLTDAANLTKHQQGMGLALGDMLKSVGPSIDQGFQEGGALLGSLGRGYADHQVEQGAQSTKDSNDFLALAGAPAGAADLVAKANGGEAAGDVLYGAGAEIPAGQMVRDGAAFGAAAKMLPKQAAGMALESGRQIAGKAQETNLDLARQLAALKAKVPGLRQEILDQILTGRRSDEALAISKKQLGLDTAKTNADITGQYVGPDGQVYPTAEAAADQAKVDADQAKAHTKAVENREGSFDGARVKIFDEARYFVKEETVEGKFGVKEKVVTKTPYAEAKLALFNKYKYLLRQSTKQYRFQLRKRLNTMIDEALAAQGIVPPAPKAKAKPNRAAAAKPRNG